ncbi:MAG: hypothetical protein NPMRTH1_570015 [Nitrosopumilales archaeon]|nr:MAG: hypothetical protein NPMRTH1_570015 [Nitrosopumilales archaeon]
MAVREEKIPVVHMMQLSKNKPCVSERTLEYLLSDSLTSSLCVNIDKGTETWVVAGMLVQYLDSFTDSVVVRDNMTPIGLIGGKEIIEGILENPTNSFFNRKVEEIMNSKIVKISKYHTLEELLYRWMQTRRAFAVIDNELFDYSAISAKKLLGIGKRCKTEIAISDIPKKTVVTFTKDQTVGDVINSMLKNKTRKLLLEGSNQYINDRLIIEKISEDLKYLKYVRNFLDSPMTTFNLAEAKVVSENLTLPELSKIMLDMAHPYVIYQNQVVSPWDICLMLLSKDLKDYQT